MSRTPEQITETFRERKKVWAPVMARRMQLRDAYNGDTVVPLPEMDKNEKVAVANLISQGLDQLAMRVGSVIPDPFSPALRPGFDASEKKAQTRRQVALGWMEANEFDVKQYRRASRLLGYAASPVVIHPDPVRRIPTWKLRDPLCTYPAPMDDPDDMCPTDCIFSYERSLGWLKQRYPTQIARLKKGPSPKNDDRYEVVEFVDHEQLTMLVVGRVETSPYSSGPEVGEDVVVLESIPNRAGYCLAIVPQRITLDRPQSQFDQMIGLFQQQAMLMALEVIAVKKGVFPTTIIESFPNAPGLPELVTGDLIKPGWTGEANIIKNGTIRELVQNPGYQTPQTIDRLERAQRLTGGIPAEYGGESSSNIRTGRRGDAVISATVDFHIQQNQRVLARSGSHEMDCAIAVDKGWFGKERKSFYVSWKGGKGHVDYVPDDTFEEGSQVSLSYSHAGADVNSLNIAIGQNIQTGMMSLQTGREIHPMVDDPEREHDRTTAEALERAMLSSIEQRAAMPPEQGGMHPTDVAKIMARVRSGKVELAQAVLEVDEERSKIQSTTEQPALPGTPEAMPGLAPGGEAGTEVLPNLGDLGKTLMQLRGPQMTVPSERGAA